MKCKKGLMFLLMYFAVVGKIDAKGEDDPFETYSLVRKEWASVQQNTSNPEAIDELARESEAQIRNTWTSQGFTSDEISPLLTIYTSYTSILSREERNSLLRTSFDSQAAWLRRGENFEYLVRDMLQFSRGEFILPQLEADEFNEVKKLWLGFAVAGYSAQVAELLNAIAQEGTKEHYLQALRLIHEKKNACTTFGTNFGLILRDAHDYFFKTYSRKGFSQKKSQGIIRFFLCVQSCSP